MATKGIDRTVAAVEVEQKTRVYKTVPENAPYGHDFKTECTDENGDNKIDYCQRYGNDTFIVMDNRFAQTLRGRGATVQMATALERKHAEQIAKDGKQFSDRLFSDLDKALKDRTVTAHDDHWTFTDSAGNEYQMFATPDSEDERTLRSITLYGEDGRTLSLANPLSDPRFAGTLSFLYYQSLESTVTTAAR